MAIDDFCKTSKRTRRPLRSKGTYEGIVAMFIFIFIFITNENRDIAIIAMYSSRADLVLGLNIISYCPGWGYLNM